MALWSSASAGLPDKPSSAGSSLRFLLAAVVGCIQATATGRGSACSARNAQKRRGYSARTRVSVSALRALVARRHDGTCRGARCEAGWAGACGGRTRGCACGLARDAGGGRCTVRRGDLRGPRERCLSARECGARCAVHSLRVRCMRGSVRSRSRKRIKGWEGGGCWTWLGSGGGSFLHSDQLAPCSLTD